MTNQNVFSDQEVFVQDSKFMMLRKRKITLCYALMCLSCSPCECLVFHHKHNQRLSERVNNNNNISRSPTTTTNKKRLLFAASSVDIAASSRNKLKRKNHKISLENESRSTITRMEPDGRRDILNMSNQDNVYKTIQAVFSSNIMSNLQSRNLQEKTTVPLKLSSRPTTTHHSSFDSDSNGAVWGISSLLFLSYLTILCYTPSALCQFSVQELCWASTNAYIVTLVASSLRRDARKSHLDHHHHHTSTQMEGVSCKSEKQSTSSSATVNYQQQNANKLLLNKKTAASPFSIGENNFMWILSTCQKAPIVVNAKKKQKTIMKSNTVLSHHVRSDTTDGKL